MKRTAFATVSVGILSTVAFIQAQSDTNRLTVPFSDPSRPGTVNVSLFQGGITVRASTGRDVIVVSESRVSNSRDQPSGKGAGLRRLSQPAGLAVTEENNVMTISSGRLMGGSDVDLQVPARTNLKLSTVNGDQILVERIEGDIEVTAVNGSIMLTDVAGAAVVHSTNGEVKVTLRQVMAQKPMSFTSFNGDVDVTLPPNTKANLKMRTDHGEVLTDFDVQITQRPATATSSTSSPGTGFGPFPPLPPLPPLPPITPGADANDRQAAERQRQAAERQRQAAEGRRQAREGRGGTRIELDSSIYGSVNGGGPEFELRTFNGNIYLRKGK
jgi:putative adhesin